MRWEGHVARMGEERKVHMVLVGKPEGKRPLGRPRRRWENGIRMRLTEIGWGRVEWILCSCEHGDEPSGSGATELLKTAFTFVCWLVERKVTNESNLLKRNGNLLKMILTYANIANRFTYYSVISYNKTSDY
jgi:hypothetical protein